MGRGRAKAKQTRVARELKYRSVSTDFGRLEAELRGSSPADDIPPNYQDLAYDEADDDYQDDDEATAEYGLDDAGRDADDDYDDYDDADDPGGDTAAARTRVAARPETET
jgi:hypothetical protein